MELPKPKPVKLTAADIERLRSMSRDGYAKILDFGLAKLVADRERALVARLRRRERGGGQETRRRPHRRRAP